VSAITDSFDLVAPHSVVIASVFGVNKKTVASEQAFKFLASQMVILTFVTRSRRAGGYGPGVPELRSANA